APASSAMSATSRSRDASSARRLSIVSSTCTAVARSLTAGDSASKPMSARSTRRQKADVGQQPEREQRVLAEGTLWPGHQPGQDRRVAAIAAVQAGDHRAVLERVTDPGPEHDDRAADGGTGQPGQVELLQD